MLVSVLVALLLHGCGDVEEPSTDVGLSPDQLANLNTAYERDVSHLVGEPVSYDPVPLPAGLVWQTNDSDPEFASPDAVPGGMARYWIHSFPLTLRLVGPDSNGSFAGYTRPINPGLVSFHPNTLNPIPDLATHWAFDPDRRTVYYRIDPKARWSDGRPITADDFLFTAELMRSRHIVSPWNNNKFTNAVVNVRKHDPLTLSIEGKSAKPPKELLVEYWMRPYPSHFIKVDPDFIRNYNWAVRPNAGPYEIAEVAKGRYVDFKRKADWWGGDRRFYRNRFNPDTVRVRVIRDPNVAFQHFLRGELDVFDLAEPVMWHRKAHGPLFDNGYVHRIKYYIDAPEYAAGMWLNMDDPLLEDRNVRIGLAHSMNLDKVIRTILRGDYERMQTHHEGYADYPNPHIRARTFDPDAAGSHFEAAGWGQRGPDGVRVKNGQRLRVRIVYGDPEVTDQLIVLREEALKLGVDLVPQLMDRASSFKQILEKKHQIGWMAWSTGIYSPGFWEFYHSANAHRTQTNNIVNFDDPEMDTLIMQYRATADLDRRVVLAQQIEQILHDSGALIPTFKAPYTRHAYWRWMKLPDGRSTRRSNSGAGPFNPFSGSGGLFWIDQPVKRATLAAKAAGQPFEPVLIEDTTHRAILDVAVSP